MKKALAIVLAALLLAVAMIPLMATAEEDPKINVEVTFNGTTTAPNYADGKVSEGEYGEKIHSFNYSAENPVSGQFLGDHDKDKVLDGDFYATWDAEYLYMAWTVNTDVHNAPDSDGNMWEHCCIQFIITPTSPKLYGATGGQIFNGDWLEVGLAISTIAGSEGTPVKCIWALSNAAKAIKADATAWLDDWDFNGTRDDTAKLTTYEVRLPWAITGLNADELGNGSQFGLTYAVAAQEDYTAVKPGMIEWQDAILGGKNPENAAVITLAGGEKDSTDIPLEDVPEPAEGEDFFRLVAAPNTPIVANSSMIITRAESFAAMNLNWAYCVFCSPVSGLENTFEIVRAEQYKGADTVPVVFGATDAITVPFPEGGFVLAVHYDDTVDPDSDATVAAGALSEKVKALEVGKKYITLNGYLLVNGKAANNAWLGIIDAPEPEESSVVEASSTEASKPEESKADASKATSTEASKTASKADTSKAAEEEGGNTGLIIAIVAAAVVVIAIVVVVVVKKKKQ